MSQTGLQRLCDLTRVDMLIEASGHALHMLHGSAAIHPVCQCVTLRSALSAGAQAQVSPFLYKDSFECCFAAIAAEDETLYIGPMFTSPISPTDKPRFCQTYGLGKNAIQPTRQFTLPEVRDIVLLANELAGNPPFPQERLILTNGSVPNEIVREQSEYAQLMLIEEAQDDSESYRHSYYEEQQLMQAIREGRTEDAVRQAESMDMDAGRFSDEALGHWKNLAIIGITLCSRAAIEGGVLPETAYRISGDYIQRCDNATDAVSLLYCRNRAIETLTNRVRDMLNRNRYSTYVASCKDYVRRHYRDKLYLADIAAYLDISPNYLSRVFKQETGERLQDYIVQTRIARAANMLVYSDQSLSEISAYVHFPSQSYFGRVFKAAYGMTPQEYRSLHKSSKAKLNDADISLLT